MVLGDFAGNTESSVAQERAGGIAVVTVIAGEGYVASVGADPRRGSHDVEEPRRETESCSFAGQNSRGVLNLRRFLRLDKRVLNFYT